MKQIFITSLLVCGILIAQAQKSAPENWFNLDAKKNKVPGVSSELAYSKLLKDKKSTSVIVAVIDGGTEVDHEDLANNIWINTKEIPDNNIDDDKNGYVDDIHGWSFIGGKEGDVKEDNLELTRMYKTLTEKYDGGMPKSEPQFGEYLKIKAEYLQRKNQASKMVTYLSDLQKALQEIIKQTGNENPTVDELNKVKPEGMAQTIALKTLVSVAKNKKKTSDLLVQIKQAEDYYGKEDKFYLNENLDSRKTVGDNYTDVTEKYYGNNHYEGPSGDHGTHVAGIIAAIRNNGKGMNGVASDVKIMVVRVVPDGDERDKDVANAIRYAVDNGAKIINMSFGKNYSPNKSAVDEAVRYAMSKDVLMVHGSGNDAKNTDTTFNFPSAKYSNNTGRASSWLEVGASHWKKGKYIAADFSNYGKENVDVFAPGVAIYSTTPDSKYGTFDGTSMASPVTAGVAALIRSYYPELSANQVKEIIMQTAVKVKGKVLLPGNPKQKVKMTDLCRTGGIVNAYKAIKLAESMTSKK